MNNGMMNSMLRAQKREKIRRNQRKMIVRGNSIRVIARIIQEKALEALAAGGRRGVS